ncbi:MAG TPA: hypothetical protein ENK49_08610 [Gammaproteobacteria bacterium]|nr:hypothetical protein [Gammaproteobacteria bacterium]
MSVFTLVGRTLAATFLLLCSTSAHATIVHLAGDTVDFFYDDAQPGMAAYGTLTAVGDSIIALPTNFFAESLNGAGLSSFSALGTVTVVAKSGYQFKSVAVAQQGDYQSSSGSTSVSTSADFDVTDSTVPATTVSTPLVSTDDFTVKGGLTAWSSSASVDLSTPMWNGVASIDLTLDSLLTASTGANGESARIQNKLVGSGLMTVVTTPVPLPASLWLFASGFVMLVGRCRRRK